jgi:hypothetical protein
MADQANGAETTTESAPTESKESRLRAFGFTHSLGFWREPNGERVFSTEDAIAAMDAGEVKPFSIPWPGVHPDTAHTFQRTEEEIDQMFHPPPPTEPPPLPSWAEPWAELVAAQLKPIIRAEVRAALKAEARKRAQEPKA